MRLVRAFSVALLAFSVPALAQQQRRHPIRFGPGVCGPTDSVYIRTAEESGGQPLFLAPAEVAKSFNLVGELTRQNRETLLWARGEFATGRDFVVSVDSTVKRLLFSLSFDTVGGRLVVFDPDGEKVTPGTPGTVMTDLNCGGLVMVAAPAPGKWHVQVSGKGKGRFWLEASGVTDIFLVNAEFVKLGGRPGHEGYFRIPGQPVAGEPAFLQAELSGKTQKVQFRLISLEDETLKPIAMKALSSSRDETEYFGQIALPSKPFRVAVTGTDENSHPFERVYSSLFRGETVEVTPLEAGLEELPAGKSSTIHFKIRNAGTARQFRILVVDTKNFLSSREPRIRTLSLESGELREIPVIFDIPAAASRSARDTVIITATSTSGLHTTNSSVVEFDVNAATMN